MVVRNDTVFFWLWVVCCRLSVVGCWFVKSLQSLIANGQSGIVTFLKLTALSSELFPADYADFRRHLQNFVNLHE